MKRFLIATLLLVASAVPALAQVNQLTILTPLTPAHRLPFNTTSTVITSAFASFTRVARVICSVTCAVQTAVSGTTPVAVNGTSNGTTTSMVLAPMVPEYIGVEPNGKIAVIGISSAGTLYVQEFGR